jgi:hypothetical protein
VVHLEAVVREPALAEAVAVPPEVETWVVKVAPELLGRVGEMDDLALRSTSFPAFSERPTAWPAVTISSANHVLSARLAVDRPAARPVQRDNKRPNALTHSKFNDRGCVALCGNACSITEKNS